MPYENGFFIEEELGNNAFSYNERKNKKIYVPSIIDLDIEDIENIKIQSDNHKIAFEDFDFDDKLSTNLGLENFYRIKVKGKEIVLFDNHNHAFYFWYEARKRGIIKDNNLLFHMDEHADTRDNNKNISKEETWDLDKVFHFTNYVLNVGDYIIPAQNEGTIGNIVQIRNTQNLESYKKQYKGNNDIKTGVILNLDLDFFQPDLDFIDYELKKEVFLDAFYKADFITVSTSPFFIDQQLAIKVFKDLIKSI